MIVCYSYSAVPLDYEELSTTLLYVPDDETERTLCTNVTIRSDSIIESDETFMVNLATSDEAVIVLSPNTSVTILDDTGN